MLRRVILSHPVPATIVALAPRTNLALPLRIHQEVATENLTVQSPNFGKDWFSADVVDDSQRQSQCIVPIAAIAAVVFTRMQLERTSPPFPPGMSGASLPARLSLSFVLRDLCRRRAALEIRTPLGAFHGTIDRVGRDHLDLAVHETGGTAARGSGQPVATRAARPSGAGAALVPPL